MALLGTGDTLATLTYGLTASQLKTYWVRSNPGSQRLPERLVLRESPNHPMSSVPWGSGKVKRTLLNVSALGGSPPMGRCMKPLD